MMATVDTEDTRVQQATAEYPWDERVYAYSQGAFRAGGVGAQMAEDGATGSGLDFLENVASSVGYEEGPSLCERCREERRWTGTAILDDRMPG